MSLWESLILDAEQVASIATLNPLGIGLTAGAAAATGTPTILTPSASSPGIGSQIGSAASGIAVLIIVIIILAVVALLIAGKLQTGKWKFYQFKKRSRTSEY
jgi:uncharacterized membrane protein YdbT with pleckstrin-like domain